MKLFKNIFAFFVALIVLVSSNGFFIEQYLCAGCHHEHKDIAFFEFGEISHNHPHCTDCEGHNNSCSCHKDEHLKHASISYFSLEQLFFNNNRIENPDIAVITMPNFGKILSEILSFSDSYLQSINTDLKLPPLLRFSAGSADYCAVVSVFRL